MIEIAPLLLMRKREREMRRALEELTHCKARPKGLLCIEQTFQ